VDVLAALTAFAVIFPVELPDKTFVATLVLATRFPAFPVWIGVAGAFAVQTTVAVLAGGLLGLLPDVLVQTAAALLFALGAIILIKGARHADAEEKKEEAELTERLATKVGHGKAAAIAFVMIFAAEWGDLSQLLTAGMVAQGRPALSVGIGAWAALATISGIGVLVGRKLIQYIKLSTIRMIGGLVCASLATATVIRIVA
jgi:Ca2+/H+ antiporter, TMEM165/GDT1 family